MVVAVLISISIIFGGKKEKISRDSQPTSTHQWIRNIWTWTAIPLNKKAKRVSKIEINQNERIKSKVISTNLHELILQENCGGIQRIRRKPRINSIVEDKKISEKIKEQIWAWNWW